MRKRSTYYYDDTPEATELRRLFHKIHRLQLEKKDQVFMVTSSNTGEGKSTIAAYLAIESARYPNNPTLLLDCDLRRPMVHKLFGLKLQNGIADVIEEHKDIGTAWKDTKLPNLKIVTAGAVHRNPVDVFTSKRFTQMIYNLRLYFKTIIVDAPPIIPVTDTLLLSNEVDGILFVVMAGKTPKRVAIRAMELLQDSKKKIMGAVINNLKSVLPYYYDYQYYNYKYINEDALETTK
ncbi:MAG: CpsD/CapB family tyrosine-protein kinase [candidate division KSB1 bacterium]|nr:CpsD/CapB family tyrosine-protein kinase [candidate division KSB1 bacterium]